MPFTKIPLVDLVTDTLNAFKEATLKTLRDNLESFHAHTTDQGKQIESRGLVALSVSGSKFNQAQATSVKINPTIQEAIATTDLTVGAAAGDFDDTQCELSVNLDVASVVEVKYQFFFQTGFSGISNLDLFWKIDTVKQAHTKKRFNPDVRSGYVMTHFLEMGSGSHTLTPSWEVLAVMGSPGTVKIPRRSTGIIFSQ